MDNDKYQRTRYCGSVAVESPEASCLAYYPQFCRTASKILASYPERRIRRSDMRPPERERDTAATRFGKAILEDEAQSCIPGMRVSEAVLNAAREWAATPAEERVRRVGWLNRLAQQAGCSRSTIVKAGHKVLRGEVA